MGKKKARKPSNAKRTVEMLENDCLTVVQVSYFMSHPFPRTVIPFGVIDVIALDKNHTGVLACRCCSIERYGEIVNELRSDLNVQKWVNMGNRFWVVAWGPLDRTIYEFSKDDFEDTVDELNKLV